MADPGKLMRDLLQKNFSKFGSIRRLCDYSSMQDPVYDADTKEVTVTATSVESVYIIFDSIALNSIFMKQEDDVTPLSIDRLAIFPKLDLLVTPHVGDMIEDDDGVVWNVIGIGVDPAGAHYELHIRPVES